MLTDDNGEFADGPFRLNRHPRARALRPEAALTRFVRFTPEFGG